MQVTVEVLFVDCVGLSEPPLLLHRALSCYKHTEDMKHAPTVYGAVCFVRGS